MIKVKKLTLRYTSDNYNYFVKFEYKDKNNKKYTKTLYVDKSLNLTETTRFRLNELYKNIIDFTETLFIFKEL
jgi:Tfp pilus assembly pilus retraction ATPase PilT